MQGQPARFFVCAEHDLCISKDFAHFGSDIGQLRKNLRGSNAEIEDSFPKYGAWFRRRLGIENDQALELFHQTVSMKSVGNLTDFVRNHMLEPFPVEARIGALTNHFDDLNRAHEAILKAKRQVELLAPLANDCTRHSEQMGVLEDLRTCREALKPYFAELKLDLLERRSHLLAGEHTRLSAQKVRCEELRDRELDEIDRLKYAIAEQGGDRLEQLARDIRDQERERSRREQRAERYIALLKIIGEASASTEATFEEQQARLGERRESVSDKESDVQNQITEWSVSLHEGRREHGVLAEEISSLNARRNNIPRTQVAMRLAICSGLGLKEEEMPFAGELIQVRDEAREWEGAIERALHNFGISLLVPDVHYERVAAWVDRTHLAGRLVYFRVRPGTMRLGELAELRRESLVRNLAIKRESNFHTWIEQRLSQGFDYVCCTTQDQFRRESRAITAAGQIRTPGERHEKDDRYPINDRSRFVLGWNNLAKIAALEAQKLELETRLFNIGEKISGAQREQATLRKQLDALAGLKEFSEFREMNWQTCSTEIARLQAERAKLEATSDTLRELTTQLVGIQESLKKSDIALSDFNKELGGVESRQKIADALRVKTTLLLADIASEIRDRLGSLRTEVLTEHQLSVESCDNREREMRETLQTRLDADSKRLERLTEKIIKAMAAFKQEYKLETADFDANIDAAFEYQKLLDQLERDDLPRFELRFKELLNVNTINEIVNFSAQLNRERENIRERIARINDSLIQIDYNTGRYIKLEFQPNEEADVRGFQSDLRACTDSSFTGAEDAQYSEDKFMKVKALIDRFRGREGLSEQDHKWTKR